MWYLFWNLIFVLKKTHIFCAFTKILNYLKSLKTKCNLFCWIYGTIDGIKKEENTVTALSILEILKMSWWTCSLLIFAGKLFSNFLYKFYFWPYFAQRAPLQMPHSRLHGYTLQNLMLHKRPFKLKICCCVP